MSKQRDTKRTARDARKVKEVKEVKEMAPFWWCAPLKNLLRALCLCHVRSCSVLYL